MDAVLLRALAKKAEDRFPSVSAFADAFSQALKGQQQPAADPRPIAQKPLAQPPGPVSGPGMPTTLPSASPLPELVSTPSRPTPVVTLPQGARRSYRVNASLLITLASVLLLLTGSIGVFFVVRNNQIATNHANATSTASSQTATANNATATAIAQATAIVVAQATATVQATAQYDGNWINDDPNTEGITRLIITNDGQTLNVHGFGRCTPSDCDWGTRSGRFNGEPFIILFDFGGGLTHQLTITFATSDGTKLQVVDVGSRSGTNTYFFHRG